MSGTPKYAAVSMSEQRLQEARRIAEAERQRRLAEQARLRAMLEAQRQRRLALARKHAERRHQMELRRKASEQRAAGSANRPSRRGPPVDRRRRASFSSAGTPAPGDPSLEPTEPMERLPQEGVERALALRAECGALIEAIVETQAAGDACDALRSTDGELAAALDGDDEAALHAAVMKAHPVLDDARNAHEARVARQVRRRIIAAAIVDALPDRYVLARRPVENPDGSIRFSALAAGGDIDVAVTGDGAMDDVIAYEVDGARVETHLEAGEVISDCPSVAASLEELHDRLATMGIVAGPLAWRGQSAWRQRARRSRSSGRERPR